MCGVWTLTSRTLQPQVLEELDTSSPLVSRTKTGSWHSVIRTRSKTCHFRGNETIYWAPTMCLLPRASSISGSQQPLRWAQLPPLCSREQPGSTRLGFSQSCEAGSGTGGNLKFCLQSLCLLSHSPHSPHPQGTAVRTRQLLRASCNSRRGNSSHSLSRSPLSHL